MIEFLSSGNTVKINDDHNSKFLTLLQNFVENIHVTIKQVSIFFTLPRLWTQLPTQKIDIPFPHRREICASIYNRGHHSTQLRQG